MRIQCKKTLTAIIVALFLTATVSITIPPAHADYSVTIQAWDSVAGWQSELIAVNGFYNTGYTTPHTFTLSEGETVTFSVPSTDSVGTPFTHWDTGETTLVISVSSAGTYTAQYYVPYSVTIQAYDNVAGWQTEPIQLDGVDQYVNTTYTFTDMTGTNTFSVPGTDNAGGSFTQWSTGETTPTITVSSGGTYTAQYYQYYFTIQAWDTVAGMQTGLPVYEDYAYWPPVGYTPYTNATSGTHTFEVPSTDNAGTAFSQWDTGETTRYISVSSEGVYTAQYWAPYDVTIEAWDSVAGFLSEPISMGGSDTGFSTPHTFTVAEGETHTFSVPSTDSVGTPFTQWDTGETSPTLSVIYPGTYTAQYEVLYIFKVATPTFSPPAGTYSSAQSVTVSCATSGATIRYTTDGSEPSSTSTVYSGPISVSVTTTIKARAFMSGMTDSDTASATYTINIPPGKVATPVFSLSAGTYSSAQSVTVSCDTSGATIRYTTDGSEPTSSSTAYSSPIVVSSTTTIKAKAFETGMTDSDTATATYIINIPKVATPTFSPPAGTYSSSQSVTLSCATSGATIRYTTDSSEPSASSTAYSSPIGVSSTTTIKAKAFMSGMTDSDTASATYTINIPAKVATPTFSPPAGPYTSSQSVTVGCATSGATITYTVDGSEPTSSSTVYSSPVSVSVTTTIKAKAFMSSMTDSDTASATYTINIPVKVATPTFSPLAGIYTSSQSVTVGCATSGATITYTVDGSEPTSSSTVYSSPVSVSVTTTIKAKAFMSSMTDSDTASATYTINIPVKVATPTFSPLAGIYTSSQSVTVGCATSGATITYTVDGSDPTSSSTVYSSSIVVSSTTTIKAKAFMSGMTDSDTASATYTINIPPGKVATPVFSLSAGTYSSAQSVTVSCDTSGATITYTVDGSEPTSSSTAYSSPIVVSSTTTIKAKAFNNGMTDSDTASATYTINVPVKVATPTFSPSAGTYSSAQSVTVSCDTSGATIGYTTDGSEPSSASTVYSGPILVDSGTLTVKAKAFKSGMTDSDTATATYTINPQQVSTPNLSPAGGSYSSAQSVTISCATSDATIRYTVDGSEPTSSSTVYSIPISVSSGTVTVKAKAFYSGMIDSDTASATYTISVEPAKVAAPTMSPPGGTYSSTQNIALSCDTEGATIRFTVDGSEPTSSSTAYSGSISVGSTTTIKVKAFMSGMTDSDTASATYTINIPSGKVATPMFSPPGGTYSASRSVALSCTTNDATIRYTVDGSEPSSTSTVYSSPVSVSVTTTIKAKAFMNGMTDSDTASATYTINTSSDFSVSASPASQSVSQGHSTTYTVTVTSVRGFSADVSLTVTGLPTGATSTFSPSTVTPTGTSTLTVATAGQSPVRTVTLTITGTSGSLTHSATVSLVVSASPSLSSPMVPLWVLAAVIGGVLIVTLAAVIAYRSSKGRKKTLGPTPTPPPPPPPPPPT